mgnify:CR=1 FL=1
MNSIFEFLRSIFATPFDKLRTLLKKSHEETAKANSVSGDVEVEILPKPGADESGSNKVVINQSSEGIVIVPNALAIRGLLLGIRPGVKGKVYFQILIGFSGLKSILTAIQLVV